MVMMVKIAPNTNQELCNSVVTVGFIPIAQQHRKEQHLFSFLNPESDEQRQSISRLRALKTFFTRLGTKQTTAVSKRTGRLLFSDSTTMEFYRCPHRVGNTASILKDYDRALRAYRHAIETNEQSGAAHYNVGMTYIDLNEIDSACRWLRRRIEVERNYRPAYIHLARLFAREKKDRNAITLLIRAAHLSPNDCHSISRSRRGVLPQRSASFSNMML
jgi:tetratricopeptide (TPR) repeat protein